MYATEKERRKRMKIKKLICKIFGHWLGREVYTVVEYERTNNYQRGLRRTTRRGMKKKVTLEYRRCRRCGAYIMVKKHKSR